MTKIFLIRHAEAEGNLYRIIQGHMNSSITKRGYKQIDALAERFRDIPLTALYSSDLRRTMTTAGAITKYHKLPMQTTDRLREIYLGASEGLSFGEAEHLDPQMMWYFNNDPDKWLVEGAETFVHCTERMLSAVTDIAEENPDGTVAVVSHGMAIRSLLARLLGIASENIRTLPHGDNTAVALLEYENGSFNVAYYNDNSHLGELSTFARQTWWKNEGKDDGNLRYEPFNVAVNAELYKELYAESWLAAHGNLIGFEPETYLRDALSHTKSDPSSCLAVYRGDELIGIVEMDTRRGKNAGYGWISLICLREKWRGKGLGIQPLGKAICLFEQMGRSSLRLCVSSENKHALGFYEHYGFERINVMQGSVAPLYLMEKKF